MQHQKDERRGEKKIVENVFSRLAVGNVLVLESSLFTDTFLSPRARKSDTSSIAPTKGLRHSREPESPLRCSRVRVPHGLWAQSLLRMAVQWQPWSLLVQPLIPSRLANKRGSARSTERVQGIDIRVLFRVVEASCSIHLLASLFPVRLSANRTMC